MNTLDATSLERLCKISRVILDSRDWKSALNDVTMMVRSLLIFDNLVVYLKRDDDTLDVIHARAVGRGKQVADDIAWGEEIAHKIIQGKQVILKESTPEKNETRLKNPYILGIPLLMGDKIYGAFLLIRFGGPPYQNSHQQLAQFIAQQITFLIDRQNFLSYEKILEDQNKQIQLQKDFISTISHELRTPLGFIKGYTTTLLRDDTKWDPSTQQEFLSIIDQETDHLQSMIDNLLDSSRLQAGLMKMNYQQVYLHKLIKDIIAREKKHHPKTETEIITQKTIIPIQGDPHRLGQVIENLISNAIKYAPKSKIIISINQDDNFTFLDVKDNGRGIQEKYLPYIFERFFRIPDQNSSIHGSGLGLFICKQIIEAHGGKIWAVSPENHGTTICIQLPNEPATLE